jgi:hypothetical protein
MTLNMFDTPQAEDGVGLEREIGVAAVAVQVSMALNGRLLLKNVKVFV